MASTQAAAPDGLAQKRKRGALATRHQVRIVNEKKAGKPAFFVSLAGNARFRASRWH